MVAENDVLLNITGASIGRCTYVPPGFGEANINQHVCILRPNDKIESRYLSYWLSSSFGQDAINIYQAGGNREGLNFQQIRSICIDVPPLPEQQEVATILSSVYNLIETTRTQINKLKDLKAGIMQELLTKGIGSMGVPHTEFKDSPVGRIPASWEIKKLEEVIDEIVDCEHKTVPYVGQSKYLVVRTTNVRNGELIYDEIKYTTKEGYEAWTKRATPSFGDVFFTREAPAGESCMVPRDLQICMGQRMVLLRPDSRVVLPEYFSLFLASEPAKLAIYELSIGTTVSRINIEDIKKIPCITPPLSEQESIFNAVESVQNSISSKQRKLDSLISVKKALMQDLLTGKVRVKIDEKEKESAVA
tara:strand:+ start:29742 stop:30824 length:1083 start_codon:yes stop_codon:yes gene_type:complete